MDPHEVAPLDAQKKLGHRDDAAWLHTQPPPPPTLTQLIEYPAAHIIGRFEFSSHQLEYVRVNLAYPKGTNSVREMVLVMKYKWPMQFRSLRESDLERLIQWLYPIPPALQYVDIETLKMIEGLNNNRPSGEVGGINNYKYGENPLDPEGGWNRHVDKQMYDSGRFASSQIVSTFKLDLRDAEVHYIRLAAKRIEPRIVQIVLATKLFSNLSSIDIALGLTSLYSILAKGRYVWMFPFTEKHVEIIWRRSLLSQTETFSMVSRRDWQNPSFRRSLGLFEEQVEAGRADETLTLDPRSYGNETSAGNLVEEIIRIFLSHVEEEVIGAFLSHVGSETDSEH